MALTPDQLIEQAAAAGCRFVLDGERVGLRGDPVKVSELAPRFRPYKAALLRALQQQAQVERKTWRVHVPGRAPFSLTCMQGCSRAELLKRYPAGTRAEAIR